MRRLLSVAAALLALIVALGVYVDTLAIDSALHTVAHGGEHPETSARRRLDADGTDPLGDALKRCDSMAKPVTGCALGSGDLRLPDLLGGESCEFRPNLVLNETVRACHCRGSACVAPELAPNGSLVLAAGVTYYGTDGVRLTATAEEAGTSVHDVYAAFRAHSPIALAPSVACKAGRAAQASPTKPNVVMLVMDGVSDCELDRYAPQLAAQLRSDERVVRFPYHHAIHTSTTRFHMAAALGGVRWTGVQARLGPHPDVWLFNRLRAQGYVTAQHGSLAGGRLAAADSREFDCMLPRLGYSGNPCAFGDTDSIAGAEMRALRQLIREEAAPVFGQWHSMHAHDVQAHRTVVYERGWLDQLLEMVEEEDTFVILMADHGPPTNERSHNWPALYVAASRSLWQRLPHATVEANARRLVTAWDLYATVLDVSGAAARARPATDIDMWSYVRATSLLRPLADRTVDEAGIDRLVPFSDRAPEDVVATVDLRVALARAREFTDLVAKTSDAAPECPLLRFDSVASLRTYEFNGERLVHVLVRLKASPDSPNSVFVKVIVMRSDRRQGVVPVALNVVSRYALNSRCAPKGARSLYCWCSVA